MPKKINIEKLLKRSTRERALVLCDDYVFQAWGNPQNFTDEERATIRESFITDRQVQMWEKIAKQEMRLRNFIPFIEERMTQASEAHHFFYSVRARYIENMGNEIRLNHILSAIQKFASDNKPLNENIISILNSPAPEALDLLKFLPPATVKLNPYGSEKSFTELVKKAGMEITERVQMAKTYIAATRQFMNDNRCNIKTYEKMMTERVDSLKDCIDSINDTITLFMLLCKMSNIKWTDTEIFTTEWIPPPYDEIPINQKAFKDACRWFGET